MIVLLPFSGFDFDAPPHGEGWGLYRYLHKHLIILRNDEGNFTNGGSNEKDGITNDISSYNIPVGGSRPH